MGALKDPVMAYYEDKRREAAELRDAIAIEEARPNPDRKRLRKLRTALDLAEYVGD